MNKSTSIWRFSLLFLCLVSLVSCKTEFERIRTSNDPGTVYKKALEYYDAEEYTKSITLMDLILSGFRGDVRAEGLYYKYAKAHYELGQYLSAASYFENFSNTFPSSKFRQDADYFSALSYYNMSPTYRLDQGYSDKAIEGFQLFANTYPQSEKVADCNKYIDELREKKEFKMFEQAKLYHELGQYQAATKTFENMLKEFPDSKRVEDIRFYMVKSSYLLSTNSVYEKQKDRLGGTIKLISLFQRKHPESKYKAEIDSYLAKCKTELKRFKNG